MYNNKQLVIIILIALIAGAVSGGIISLFINSSQNEFEEFYTIEIATNVSPSDFVSDLEHGSITGLVVDLRSKSAYEAGHLVTAINIDTSLMDEEQLINAFKELPKDKPIITYCYSSYCMLSRKVGKVLADNGIYVMHFTAGAYEIERDYNDFIVTGLEPGEYISTMQNNDVCNVDSEFNC